MQGYPFVWGIVCFSVVTLPQWLESVWSLFKEKPMFQELKSFVLDLGFSDMSGFWISVPVGLLMFGLLFWRQRESKNLNGVNQLRINFSRTENASFYQVGHIEAGDDLIYYELHRACIESSVVMANIRVTLEFIEPCPLDLRGKLPLSLHVQHDDTDKQRTFDLGKNDKKYIDVIQRRYSLNDRSGRLVICHIQPGVTTDISDDQAYELTIKAKSDDYEDSRIFSINVKPDHTRQTIDGKGLFMEMLDDQDATRS